MNKINFILPKKQLVKKTLINIDDDDKYFKD